MQKRKPRVIKDFGKLDSDIQEQIKLIYPTGFYEHLISYTDKEGNERFALPFETDEKYYMVRMSIEEAKKIVNDDADYDSNGILRNTIQEEYLEKHQDVEYLSEYENLGNISDVDIIEQTNNDDE
ncbi:MAG: hypothetical protein R6U95_10165 [Bacteroidales bacterium]